MGENHSTDKNKLIEAYNRMMEQTKKAIGDVEQDAEIGLNQAIDVAKENLSALEEWSAEEIELVGEYLRRDLHDAATFLGEHGGELADWLRFDLIMIEAKLAELFSGMVDHTREELDRLANEAVVYGEWHTGEITGPGTLECKGCGEKLHFHRTSHIPPCPKCHESKFRRLAKGE